MSLLTDIEISEKLIEEMLKLRDDEDIQLWKQGDILKDAAFSKAEMRKLAEILQRKLSTLVERERVAKETPAEYRKPEYSWTIYKVFTRIEDPAVRWHEMFSRTDWTYDSAVRFVRTVLSSKNSSPLTPTYYKTMTIPGTTIKVRGETLNGVIIVEVSVGNRLSAIVNQNASSTTIEFRE